jgi:3-phosphoshikimate 1-carboxyvinyltransferase
MGGGAVTMHASEMPLVTAGGTGMPVDVAPSAALRGELALPGDKSISHRALMLGLLATGQTRIKGAADGGDVRSTAGIVAALGAEVSRSSGEAGNVDYVVRSPGRDGLDQPNAPLDCGNSGTSMRLFAGILAGTQVRAILDGDASLRRRPMARIVEPLRQMGAWLEGMAGEKPPLIVAGTNPLRAVDWRTPVPSAQVKSAILLAGLAAAGTTRVRESVATRDHTERMLRARGVVVRSMPGGNGGPVVEVDGMATVGARDELVPGDPSAAAFWLVAGSIHRDAEIHLRGVGVNPTRRAVIDLLLRMGASIEEVGAADDGVGEPIADIVVRSTDLRGIDVPPAETAAAIDEIPVLCLAATQADGRSVIRGAGELRHKESDRIAGIVEGLSRLGARITSDGDDIVIDGPTELCGATVDSLADHRLALTFAIAGLVATGRTTIRGADSVAISYPSVFADLERIRS